MLADVLIKTDNFIKAESILKEVLDFSEQNNSKNNLNSIYLQLSDIYELKEDYKNSLTYFKKYKTVNEELYNNETSKRIKNLEIIQKTNLLLV
ncbi:MAG: tetratricopeptide repeat protein [Saprospirales bacterium]|nr:tetratricopeptide repeat protein [Saprospirales bacterium]